MTYSHMANVTLPSARRGFTSEFGKGSGGSLLLLSPAQLFMDTCFGLIYSLFSVCQCFFQKSYNRDIWVSFVCSILLSLITKSSYFEIIWSFMNRYQLNTTTVWVLYSQASRAISIGQLHISLCFHIQPINVVVFNGSLEE